MCAYFRDYCWKGGRPIGIGKTSREASLCYRIVSDPYQKWISIEIYGEREFASLLYDSRLLDFRKLKPTEQVAWRKEPINSQESWIYNEDDRLILRERVKESACEIYSPHGIFLCQYAFFKKEARVVLYDAHSHPVMEQLYRTYDGGEFLDLVEENWTPSADSSARTLCG